MFLSQWTLASFYGLVVPSGYWQMVTGHSFLISVAEQLSLASDSYSVALTNSNLPVVPCQWF